MCMFYCIVQMEQKSTTETERERAREIFYGLKYQARYTNNNIIFIITSTTTTLFACNSAQAQHSSHNHNNELIVM